MKINELVSFRYSITKSPNEIYSLSMGLGASHVNMTTTYAQLIKKHIYELKEVGPTSSRQQVERNHLTALRAFLRTIQKHETSPVGVELTEEFEHQLKSHLQTSGLGNRSKSDRKSLLNAWRDSFLSLSEVPVMRTRRERSFAAATPAEQNPFERALWAALKKAKIAPKTAAKRAGISVSAIGRWTRGAIPNTRTTSAFASLDVVLGLHPGTLSQAYQLAAGKDNSSSQNAYRLRLREQTKEEYCLKEVAVTPAFMQEWRAFFNYKTARTQGALLRGKKSRWSLVEVRNSTVKPSVFNSKGGEVSATATIIWSKFSRFFGFLQLPVADGGFGLPCDEAQTMAWFAVPDAIDAYMKFLKRRSDDLVHSGHSVLATTIMSLTHAAHGYLTQIPSLADKLPSHVIEGKSWKELCKESWETAGSWKSDAHDKSRDPSLPIQFLLDMAEPSAPLFAAMQKLRRVGDGEMTNSMAEAIARRDELLLGLLLSNPLRGKNLKLLTFKANNQGNIYKAPNSQWRIRILGSVFKNKNRVGNNKYDVPIASWLQRLVDDYIQHFRPVLDKLSTSDYFFLSSRGGRFNSLDTQIFDLTQRHIPGCSGFRPHAFRHLVATDWLNKNPNDFLTVAELLNDTIEVVMGNYAHLKKDVAFGRYEAYLHKVLPPGMAF